MPDQVFEEYKELVASAFNSSMRTLKAATDGLSEDDLFFQPTKDTNSIAWLAWHLSRRKDYYSAKMLDEPQVWVSGGWAERYGLDAVDTGMGYTSEQVTAFHPSPDLIFGYVDAVHEAAIDRFSRLEPDMLSKEYDLDGNRGNTAGRAVLPSPISDSLIHTGQIAYLRGMITGRGWQRY